MAAVRAHTMQTSTSSSIRVDGQPLAATTSAPNAKGNAKTVCENRINRKNRATEFSDRANSNCRSCEFMLESKIEIQQISQACARAGKDWRAMRKKQPFDWPSEKFLERAPHLFLV